MSSAAAAVPEELLSPALREHVRTACLEIDSCDDLVARARVAGVDLPSALAEAGATRRREYLAGRICARAALADLVGPAAARAAELGRNGDGVPEWPEGVVGSISHGAGTGFAAVARTSACGCLGIDVERVVSPERAVRLSGRVMGKSEVRLARSLSWSEAEWFALVFSAKESAYKAVFPHARRFLGFADMELASVSQAVGGALAGDLQVELDSGRPGSTGSSGSTSPLREPNQRPHNRRGGVAADDAGWKLRGRYCFTGLGSDAPRVWTLVGAFAPGD